MLLQAWKGTAIVGKQIPELNLPMHAAASQNGDVISSPGIPIDS
jgi:hypothetical protein